MTYEKSRIMKNPEEKKSLHKLELREDVVDSKSAETQMSFINELETISIRLLGCNRCQKNGSVVCKLQKRLDLFEIFAKLY